MRDLDILQEIAKRQSVLEVECRRCVHLARLHVSHLLFEHGPDLPASAIRGIAAADCPLMQDDGSRHLCEVFLRGVTK